MPEMGDMERLRDYEQHGSEAAFAEVVQRHVNLVYSVALRQVGIAAHAEEITQAVFVILARKAPTLGPDTILEGWLHETTRLTALSFLRGERRRQFREQEVYMQSTLPDSPDAQTWQQLAPLLDEALARLGKKDRDAVILRFLKEKNLNEVATALRVNESAAQRRVHRAVEKLRKFFTKRGIAVTEAALMAAISAHSVQAAPATLAGFVTAVAFAKGVAASGSTVATANAAMKLMAWAKAKVASAVVLTLALAAGTGTMAVERIIAPRTEFIRITGHGQIAFVEPADNGSTNQKAHLELGRTGKSTVVGNVRLVILTNGRSYRVSIVSEDSGSPTNHDFDVKADYGSDGEDTFLLSDMPSFFHRTHDGVGGFIYPGSFLRSNPYLVFPILQAAWMAYCSSNYFDVPIHHTGLQFGNQYPDFVTNLVTYWPGSTIPQTITGWCRNWWILPRTNSLQPKIAVELKQYPNGFKAWRFSARDPVTVGTIPVPRCLTAEEFWPKSSQLPVNGEDTELTSIVTFTADSIELGHGQFDPLPPVPVADLQVMDHRFENIAGPFVIGSHATLRGWPARGSFEFNKAAAEAEKIASENRVSIAERRKHEQVIPPTRQP